MNTTRARVLRNGMTEPEIILWSRLKRLRSSGFQFRRQAPFRRFILDFVEFNHRLVVELDGSQHRDEAQAEHDRLRTRMLEQAGFTVLRYPNALVRLNLGWVLDGIVCGLAETDPQRERRRD
jgi:very-short-patch-repair endonuclease